MAECYYFLHDQTNLLLNFVILYPLSPLLPSLILSLITRAHCFSATATFMLFLSRKLAARAAEHCFNRLSFKSTLIYLPPFLLAHTLIVYEPIIDRLTHLCRLMLNTDRTVLATLSRGLVYFNGTTVLPHTHSVDLLKNDICLSSDGLMLFFVLSQHLLSSYSYTFYHCQSVSPYPHPNQLGCHFFLCMWSLNEVCVFCVFYS